MNKIASILLVLLLSTAARAAETPSIIKEGFDAYKERGVAAGFERWMRGSALEGDTTTKLQILGGMTQIEAAYGKIESYEVIATFAPTKRLQRIYTVSYHAKGPIFGYFDLYATEKGWVGYMFNFNTKPQEILPRSLLDKNG
jgi:hypothetical protein